MSYAQLYSFYRELESSEEKLILELKEWLEAQNFDSAKAISFFSSHKKFIKFFPVFVIEIDSLWEKREVVKEEFPLDYIEKLQGKVELKEKVDIWEREYFPPVQYIKEEFEWILPKPYQMITCPRCQKLDDKCPFCGGGGKLAYVEKAKISFIPQRDVFFEKKGDVKNSILNLDNSLVLFQKEVEQLPFKMDVSEDYLILINQKLKELLAQYQKDNVKFRRFRVKFKIIPILKIDFLDIGVSWYLYGKEPAFYIPNLSQFRPKFSYFKSLIISALLGIFLGLGFFLLENRIGISEKLSPYLKKNLTFIQGKKVSKSPYLIARKYLKEGKLKEAYLILKSLYPKNEDEMKLEEFIKTFLPKRKYYPLKYRFESELETNLWPYKIYFLDNKIEAIEFKSLVSWEDIKVKRGDIIGKRYRVEKIFLDKVILKDKNSPKEFIFKLPLNRGVDEGYSFLLPALQKKKMVYPISKYQVKSFRILVDPTFKERKILEIDYQNSSSAPQRPKFWVVFFSKYPQIVDLFCFQSWKVVLAGQTEKSFFPLLLKKDVLYKKISVLTDNDLVKTELYFKLLLYLKKILPLSLSSGKRIELKLKDGRELKVSFSFQKRNKIIIKVEGLLKDKIYKLYLWDKDKKVFFINSFKGKDLVQKELSLSEDAYFFNIKD